MQLETDWITYDGPTGPVSAHLARPRAASGPLPGTIVIQEIWGVDGHIAELTERFATAGYVAIAPDLYSAGGGRPGTWSARIARKLGRDLIRAYHSRANSCCSHGTSPR